MVAAEQLPIEAPKHSHFMMIPNMAGDELDPFEFRLFAHYTRVCWQNSGECWQSVKTIHDATGISLGMITRSRKSLEAKGYIAVTIPDGKSRNRGEAINVIILDRWQENAARYGKVDSPDEQGVSYSEIAVSPHELADSPGETNKINKDIYTQEQEKKDKDKTDNPPVANSELPADAPVSQSVSENPEQSPIIELDIPHGEPGHEQWQPPEARAIVPPAGIFVLEEIPSKHEPPAHQQPVEDEVSSAPPPVRVNPLPEPEYKHNDMWEESQLDREIPGLNPGDPPLYKPDLQWKKVQEAFEDVVGGTIGKTISDALNDGISIRGADAVVSLIKSAVKADDRLRYVMGSLKKWHDEPVPRPSKNSKEKRVDDGIIWNDDGSLGGYT